MVWSTDQGTSRVPMTVGGEEGGEGVVLAIEPHACFPPTPPIATSPPPLTGSSSSANHWGAPTASCLLPARRGGVGEAGNYPSVRGEHRPDGRTIRLHTLTTPTQQEKLLPQLGTSRASCIARGNDP